jgi:hypothetical protein
MKIKLLLSSRCRNVAAGLLLDLILLAAGSAQAQNFVKNPDFEEPLGPDNWTIVYTNVTDGSVPLANRPTNCGPNDFMIAGRTTMAHKDMAKPDSAAWDGTGTNYWSKFGGHFAPNHTWLMHAYFKQVLTNLTPFAQYQVSAWMAQMTKNDAFLDRAQVYMEVLGGAAGNVARKTPYVTANCHNNPAGWQIYSVTNSASSSGRLEIRLHFNKNQVIAETWEYRNLNAFYDHVSVIPAGQTGYLPSYKILSFGRTNQDISLQWQTVMNNRYRLQASTNPADPLAWTWVERSPYLDTNFFATGTSFTFKTNLTSLFSYAPAFDPIAPLFFRIHSTSFQP